MTPAQYTYMRYIKCCWKHQLNEDHYVYESKLKKTVYRLVNKNKAAYCEVSFSGLMQKPEPTSVDASCYWLLLYLIMTYCLIIGLDFRKVLWTCCIYISLNGKSSDM